MTTTTIGVIGPFVALSRLQARKKSEGGIVFPVNALEHNESDFWQILGIGDKPTKGKIKGKLREQCARDLLPKEIKRGDLVVVSTHGDREFESDDGNTIIVHINSLIAFYKKEEVNPITTHVNDILDAGKNEADSSNVIQHKFK